MHNLWVRNIRNVSARVSYINPILPVMKASALCCCAKVIKKFLNFQVKIWSNPPLKLVLHVFKFHSFARIASFCSAAAVLFWMIACEFSWCLRHFKATATSEINNHDEYKTGYEWHHSTGLARNSWCQSSKLHLCCMLEFTNSERVNPRSRFQNFESDWVKLCQISVKLHQTQTTPKLWFNKSQIVDQIHTLCWKTERNGGLGGTVQINQEGRKAKE